MRWLGVLAVVLALSACGGAKHTPSSPARKAVAAYITRVDNTETQLSIPLRAIAVATSAYAHGRPAVETAAAFALAQQTLLNLYLRLAGIKPPPQAAKLHVLLLELVKRQAATAGELRALVVFNPSLIHALQPLTAAAATAKAALHAAKKPAAVAAALQAYRAAIDGVVANVRLLQPPAAELPVFNAQLARLTASSAALRGFEQAVRANRPVAAAKYQQAIGVAAASAGTRANQLAERQAVITYDARVASLQTLTRRVLDERDHLQASLR